MANKVKYNLKNVHYAIATTGGYSTVVDWPGAVNLTLDPTGDDYKFYADGEVYYDYHTNNGYSGTLEMALIPEGFKTSVLGEVSTGGKVWEIDDVQTVYFALGFQIDGDANDNLYWFYNCTASRPSITGATKEDSIEVQTETLNFSNSPDPRITLTVDGKSKHPIKVRNASTSTTTATQWFTAVYTS